MSYDKTTEQIYFQNIYVQPYMLMSNKVHILIGNIVIEYNIA